MNYLTLHQIDTFIEIILKKSCQRKRADDFSSVFKLYKSDPRQCMFFLHTNTHAMVIVFLKYKIILFDPAGMYSPLLKKAVDYFSVYYTIVHQSIQPCQMWNSNHCSYYCLYFLYYLYANNYMLETQVSLLLEYMTHLSDLYICLFILEQLSK